MICIQQLDFVFCFCFEKLNVFVQNLVLCVHTNVLDSSA